MKLRLRYLNQCSSIQATYFDHVPVNSLKGAAVTAEAFEVPVENANLKAK